jgi:hypothetical protein
MGLNIGGNIISNNSLREYEYNSVIQDGLLCHLDARIFDTISGTTWYDFSGNGSHATLYNGPTYNSEEGSLTFDGTNDYALISTITNYKSVNLWVYLNTRGTYLFDARTGSPSGYFWFPGGDGGYGPDWSDFYVNGVSVSDVLTNIPTGQWTNLYVKNSGKRTGNFYLFSRYTVQEYQAGKYSQFLAYNRDLTAAEILHNYNVSKSRYGL